MIIETRKKLGLIILRNVGTIHRLGTHGLTRRSSIESRLVKRHLLTERISHEHHLEELDITANAFS
jgi:hypothetical protein